MRPSYAPRYLYDGDQVIAEYDGNNNLLRKYIYGPEIDQPVCMIEVADSNTTYYYHYDSLGSVVALSDPNGDTVQTYEYSVYGQVAVEDVNHPNPYMFTGRRFDIEIGLYYYRTRYYNPFIGRFLQADSVGYKDGMNLYRCSKNNPVNMTDPSGCGGQDPCCYGFGTPSPPPRGGEDSLNSAGSANYSVTTASNDSRRIPQVGQDTSCWGICERNILGRALQSCYLCCNENSPQFENNNRLSTCWGVQCAISALPDSFRYPGMRPIPRYGIDKRDFPALSLIVLLFIVLVRMCLCYVLLERRRVFYGVDRG